MVVRLQSTFCLVETPGNVTQFQRLFYFSVRDLISSYKGTSWDRRTDNLWSLLPFPCICWWYNFYFKGYQFCKKYGTYFPFFSDFSGSRPNLSNCDITGIGVLKGVQVEFCGMRCVYLTNNTLKVLGTHFAYNEETDRGRKSLHSCNKYSRSTKNMEN